MKDSYSEIKRKKLRLKAAEARIWQILYSAYNDKTRTQYYIRREIDLLKKLDALK